MINKLKLSPNKLQLLVIIIIMIAAVGNNYSTEVNWDFKELSATKKEVRFASAYRFHLIITLKNLESSESKPEVNALVEVISGGKTVYTMEDVTVESGKYISQGEEINIRKSLSCDALKCISKEPYAEIRVTIGEVSKTFTVINSGYFSDSKKLSEF